MDETKYVTWDVHKEFSQRIEDENNRQNKRIQLLEDHLEEVRNLTVSTEKLATNMEHMVKSQNSMNETLARQGERLDAIEKEPAEKWKQISGIVLSMIVGALVTFVLAKIGL